MSSSILPSDAEIFERLAQARRDGAAQLNPRAGRAVGALIDWSGQIKSLAAHVTHGQALLSMGPAELLAGAEMELAALRAQLASAAAEIERQTSAADESHQRGEAVQPTLKTAARHKRVLDLWFPEEPIAQNQPAIAKLPGSA